MDQPPQRAKGESRMNGCTRETQHGGTEWMASVTGAVRPGKSELQHCTTRRGKGICY